MIYRISQIAICCAAFVAMLLGMVLKLSATELRSITPADLTSISGVNWINPEVDVTAISGDGNMIAGRIWNTGVIYDCVKNICGVEPFVWPLSDNVAGSMIATPVPLNVGSSNTNAGPPVLATGLSHDGTDILVVAEYRYLESAIVNLGQPILLRPSIDPQAQLWASDISSDGKVVVGNVGAQPILWRESVGLQPITGLPNSFSFSADVVSGDGQGVVLNAQPSAVDSSWASAPRGNAFYWTATTGLIELPQLPGDDYSHGTASSFDGEIIVGNSVSFTLPFTYKNHAMRWIEGVQTPLDVPAGFSFSTAKDVSGDGKLVVGKASNQVEHQPFEFTLDPSSDWFAFGPSFPTTDRAMIWDANGQVFDMKVFLETRYGLETQLAGWLLTDATAISDEGNVIAGRGINPEGKIAIWIAELTIPEPPSAVIALAGIVLLAAGRRKQCAIVPSVDRFCNHYSQ